MARHAVNMDTQHNSPRQGDHRIADLWDVKYAAGMYVGESPLPFTETILAELDKNPGIRSRRGMCVGCGNGRNYIPLARAGLDLVGLDVSEVGLKQIAAHEPSLEPKLVRANFLEHGGRFGYVIAIQSFQHGTRSVSERYFHHAAAMLERGGLLFVRVNSTDTTIMFPHQILEESDAGFTVLYLDGPKRGIHVRFYTKEGLLRVVREAGLSVVRGPVSVASREAERAGSWNQWEIVVTLEADG